MSAETHACFWPLACAAALLLASPPAAATTYSLEGYAGTQNAPTQEVLPTTVGPISLDIPNALDAPRSATANGFVDHGLVQVRARVEAPAGTPSIGDIVASMSGSWSDTITFAAPGEIPSLPGVEIIEGATPGTAELVVRIDGSLINLFGGSTSRSYYDATFFDGITAANVFGYFDAPFASGTSPPTTLTFPVSFVYGVPLEVLFRLTVAVGIGWEGNADADYLAVASFDHSALWGGAQGVQALVSDGMGGTSSVALPGGSWSLTSPSFDYTEAVVVPEPGPLSLLLAGLLMLAARSRPLNPSSNGHRGPTPAPVGSARALS